MASMKRPRLTHVEPLDGWQLQLTFVDGSVTTVDFAPLLEESPGLAPLREAGVFAQAMLVAGEGWAVTWPAVDIQIGADTLWLDAQAQHAADENSRIFAQWRAPWSVAHGGGQGTGADAPHHQRLWLERPSGAALYRPGVPGLGSRTALTRPGRDRWRKRREWRRSREVRVAAQGNEITHGPSV